MKFETVNDLDDEKFRRLEVNKPSTNRKPIIFLTTESTEHTEEKGKSGSQSSNAFLENSYIKINQKTNFTIR
jgi:hypothetical protein